MAHIGVDHRPPLLGGDPLQLVRAALAGGDLRLQIGDVAVRIARRPSPFAEQRPHLRLAEAAGIDEQDIVDQHALLVDRAAVRRHRSRRDPADIGMMAARRDEPGRAGVALAAKTGMITVMSGRCVPPR